jgi:hypothetical protein
VKEREKERGSDFELVAEIKEGYRAVMRKVKWKEERGNKVLKM